MSQLQTNPAAVAAAAPDISVAESHLGKVLTLIHRVIPKLDAPERAAEVQALLQKAANCLESARQALNHQDASPRGVGTIPQAVATVVEPEIAAVIAAAVAVLFDRPYRLVSVQQVTTPVPHLNVWALEGRTQIFQSHKIR